MPKGAMSQAERQQIRVRLVGKKNQPGEWAEQLPPARDVLLKGDPTVVRTTGGLSHMISRLRSEEAIGCDLETTGLCPHANHPVTIQFGIEDGSSWIVDVTALVPGMKDWEPGDPLVDPLREIECPESLLDLKAFFEDPARPVLCFHNGCFDLQFLMALGIQCRHKLFDTLIAHRILTAGKEDHPALFSSLQWCAGHLLGVWVSKEEQHEEDRSWADKLSDLEALRYAGTDPLLPLYLRNGMRRPDGSLYSGMRAQIMRDKPKTGPGLKNIAAIDFGAVPATAEMCFSGLWFDPAVLKANLLDRQQREKEAHKQLLEEASTLLFEKTGRRIQRDLIGRPSLNFGSAPQVAKFLRDVGVNLPEGDSVDQQVLKLLVDPPAIIDTYLAWKDLGTQVKQLITFRDAISPATGRIHASFVQYGADSGRFTCIAEGQPITVPGGTTPIEELKPGDWVYALDEQGRPVPKRVLNVWDNGLRETVAVKWEAKSHKDPKEGELICTPDHRIRTDRGWVEAGQLEQGEVVWHLRRGPGAYDRPRMYARGSFCDWEQRILKREIFGKTGRAWHIHHKDEVPANNEVGNLEVLPCRDHHQHHSQNPTWLNTAEVKERSRASYVEAGYRLENSPHWIEVDRFGLLRMLARAKGQTSKVSMDFETYKRKCELAGIDLKAASARYSRGTGVFLSKANVRKALEQAGSVKAAYPLLGIGFYRMQQLMAEFGLAPTNHRVVSVSPAGMRQVFDIEVEDLHNFIASEVCSHNCRQPNCQNPSKHAGLRESVKPRPGNKFVICDYSGVEMRLMAALANDKTMLQAIKDGVDIHRFTASGIMKKPMEEISKAERSQGKISGFALIYACSAETLKDYAQSGFGVVMTAEEAVRNRTGFFELYTGVAAFHGRIKEELFRLKRAFENDPEGAPPTYETRTLAGRRRTLPYGSMTAQTATNSPTQGSGADALLLAMGRMRKAWDDAGLKGWRIVNSVHDEIVAEGPEETAELACQIVKETMEAAGNQLVPAVPIAAEAGIADSWAEK